MRDLVPENFPDCADFLTVADRRRRAVSVDVVHFALHRRKGLAHAADGAFRSEEHTSELQSLMRISYAVFCLKNKKKNININKISTQHHNNVLSQKMNIARNIT